MRISYERAGQCFWHLGCLAQRHAPPMKVERDENNLSLLRCTACGCAGWYPHGSVGEVCCEPESQGHEAAASRNTDTRDPYTYACDYLRTKVGAHISRSEMSQIRGLIASACGLDDRGVAEALAREYRNLTDDDYARSTAQALYRAEGAAS